MRLMLVVLTFVTGLVDAVTYLDFGHVFAANMTGNVIVLGFALVGAGEISATASIVSLAGFIVGAALSARVAAALRDTRARWLLTMLATEAGLLTIGAALCLTVRPAADLAIVGVLAVAMGMRIVSVRRLGVADVSTTVITSTLAALAADALLSGAPIRAGGVRLACLGALLLGAVTGALAVGHGAAGVLGIAAGLLLILTLGAIGEAGNGDASAHTQSASGPA